MKKFKLIILFCTPILSIVISILSMYYAFFDSRIGYFIAYQGSGLIENGISIEIFREILSPYTITFLIIFVLSTIVFISSTILSILKIRVLIKTNITKKDG